MEQVILFIEDEEALTPYVILARAENKFPGWQIIVKDRIDDTIKWCEQQEANDKKLIFVVDSRMTTDILPEYLEKALTNEKTVREQVSDFISDDRFTGALGTIVLKKLMPGCKTILISAFYRTINEARRRHATLDKTLRKSIDVELPKIGGPEEGLTQAISSQITSSWNL